MSKKARFGRPGLIAGALSIALIAPVTPVAPPTIVAVAFAQVVTNQDTFKKTFATTNLRGKSEATVIDSNTKAPVQFQPNTKISYAGNALPNYRWGVRMENDTIVLTKPPKNNEPGLHDIPVSVKVPNSDGTFNEFNATLNVVVVDEPSWADQLSGFGNTADGSFTRESLDFTNGAQVANNFSVPVDAKVEWNGPLTGRWAVSNENGKIRLNPPSNWSGNDIDEDIPVKITKDGDSIDRTVRIRATKPEAQNLPTWAKLLSQFLATLIGGATGRGGAGGGTGGGGGGSSLPAGLFEGLVNITINADNPSINITGNGVIHPGAIAGNGVIQDGAVRGNGVVQDGAIRDNVGVQDGAIRDNVGIAPGGVVGVEAGALSGALSSSKKAEKDSEEGGESAAKAKLKDPKCIASLVGFGVPAAILIPVLLANILRIPGFEGIQDAMKAAATSMGPGLNITPEALAAGVGGFAGAGAVAGLVASITQCVPSKEEKAAAQAEASAESDTTTTTS